MFRPPLPTVLPAVSGPTRIRHNMHLHKMHKFHKMHHHMMHQHRGPPRFNDAEDEALLSAVKQFPSLYDSSHEDYKNGKVKTDIWDNIAVGLGRDVETCKRRWKDIKDNYYKIKRKHKMGNCKWPLVGKLAFLDSAGPEKRMGPYRFEMDGFQSTSPETSPQMRADTDGQDIEETEGPSSSRAPEVSRVESQSFSRRHNSTRNQSAQENDDVDLFMQSIALQVKKMSPQMVARAKLNILTTVHDIQFETSSNEENFQVNDDEQIPVSVSEKELN